MPIRVRVDDFPHTKGEPQHTLAAFRDFDRRLRSLMGGARYLLGVIPKRCTPEHLVYLRDETDCEIGMHGIEHDESKLDLFKNEFEPYLTRKAVEDRLWRNRQALELAVGRWVHVYMPPRNMIDQRTIDVLSACGFDAYTTGPETPERFRTGEHPRGLTYLPSHPPHEYGRTDEMLKQRSYDVLNDRHRSGLDTILTLHWTWETNIGLENMDRFLRQIPSDRFASFS